MSVFQTYLEQILYSKLIAFGQLLSHAWGESKVFNTPEKMKGNRLVLIKEVEIKKPVTAGKKNLVTFTGQHFLI